MKSPELLKNLPTPVQIVWRPMLLISLVLHGIVLILPVPSTWETSKPEEQVKVTQLPSLSTSPESSGNSPEEPKAKTSPTPSQPTPSMSASPSQPAINSFDYPIQPTPTLSPTIEFSPSISADPQPSPSQSPSSSREETQTTEEKTTETTDQTGGSGINTNDENVQDPLEKFLENFPFPEAAQVGSLGILSGDADTSARHVQQPLGQVIKYYGKELPDRNYTLANPSTDDSDFKIYQVYQDQVSRYLHLIFNGENTVIFLSETQVARKDLQNLEVETAEERELKETVDQVIIAGKYDKQLSESVKKILDDGYNHLGTVYEKAPEQVCSQISSQLKDKGFGVGQCDKREEDNIVYYSIMKNDFIGILLLIPTPYENGSGTSIISYDDF